MTTALKGIYSEGVIKPLKKINLPNNYPVEIYFVIPVNKIKDKLDAFKKTAGILPNLPENFSEIIRNESENNLKKKWQE